GGEGGLAVRVLRLREGGERGQNPLGRGAEAASGRGRVLGRRPEVYPEVERKRARAWLLVPLTDGGGMGIRLSGWGHFGGRVLVPLLLRQAHQRLVLRASELRRLLSVRQGAEGEVPGAHVACRRLPVEQAGSVRHARQRVAMDRHRSGLRAVEPGRRLEKPPHLLPEG